MVLETLKVDFKPLYQSIHIYTALDSLDELRKSYQADRKVRPSKRNQLHTLIIVPKAQSDLILPVPLQLSSLVALTEQIIGFFIIESHVLQTTGSFRSKAEVEELWDAIAARLSDAVDGALRNVTDPDSYLYAKETLIAFILTLEVYIYLLLTWHYSQSLSLSRHINIRRRLYMRPFSAYSRGTPLCWNGNSANASKT